MTAQLLSAVKRCFKTGSMPWSVTDDISVYIAKCSQCQVRSVSPHIGPCTATGISFSHQGKGRYHPTSSCFLLQAPEKGWGHVQHPNGFWFQTYGSNAVKSMLKTERTRVFWALPRSLEVQFFYKLSIPRHLSHKGNLFRWRCLNACLWKARTATTTHRNEHNKCE